MIRSLFKARRFFPVFAQTRTFASDLNMFCFQCEQTRGGKHCLAPKGVCDKNPEVAALQDLLVEIGKRVASYARLGATVGYNDMSVDRWVLDSYFATLTNVNFDSKRFGVYLEEGERMLKQAREGYIKACEKANVTPKTVEQGDWNFKPNIKELSKEGRVYGIDTKKGDWNMVCVREMALYGMKGGIAYLHHAMRLGYESRKLYDEMMQMLDDIRHDMPLGDALKIALKVGEWNYGVMELLDKANTETYGKPEITMMRTTPIKGKCIAVSGHDLKDLELVLQQTVGTGINVYTHGEMLPCNAYPGLKKYKHLIGNYGGAWQRQRSEFKAFPGSILMTTNCIIPPAKEYMHRLFTRASVGWPGVKHLDGYNMNELIQAALKEPGFSADAAKKEIPIGFARDTIMSVAPAILDAIKNKTLRHIFLIGGCDGYELNRTYYTDFAKQVPKDCLILTLACGKYRFNMLDLGHIEIGGKKIPRVLDVGQCNDAYSAIQVALALSKATGLSVNDLPLSFVLSWFEQKAVAILLTLLHFGIKNMLLGPNLPAFVPPDVLNTLVKAYGIRPLTTPEADMKFLLNRHQ